jgi:hypothetical protein
MFDDAASEFALSEFHFTVLQLLRIAREWIQESVEDLRVLVKDLEVDYTDGKHCFLPGPLEFNRAATEAFRQTWESVTSNQQSLAKGLLSRIAKKEEEVKSLRDGVSQLASMV